MIYTLFRQKILFWFSNIFSRIYLSAILEIFQKKYFLTFSRGICDFVVSVNTNEFYSCCDDISAFPALSGVFGIFFVDFFVRTFFFWNLFGIFLNFFYSLFSLWFTVIDMYRPDGAGGGGDTDNITFVLYLCFI